MGWSNRPPPKRAGGKKKAEIPKIENVLGSSGMVADQTGSKQNLTREKRSVRIPSN
jgi:hypothetical protein